MARGRKPAVTPAKEQPEDVQPATQADEADAPVAGEVPAVEAAPQPASERREAVAKTPISYGRCEGVQFKIETGDVLSQVLSYGHDAGGKGVTLTQGEIRSLVVHGLAEYRDL